MAAPRVDRRLAAIMAVDVVGYSWLIGVDEADTLARVKAHRKELSEPSIAEHHGRVVKLTGDGALVEFASAVDAVECAVALQAGMAGREAAEPEARRIRYRIGINIGDIVLEDGDIFGDGVNVAARLEGLAAPGGICIARNVYNQVKSKLDLAFEPMGEHKVKNIAEPITVYRVLPRAGARPNTRPAALASTLHGRPPAAIAAAVMLLAAAVAGTWYAFWRPAAAPPAAVAEAAGSGGPQAKPALPLPDKPSIAVLPFENLSGDPRQERLADGITEDIITDLSRFRELFVIARNSTFVYKGKPTDVRRIARELGVQFVLEGSLQTDGDQVRITAQLIDATTGNHVWSERYGRPLDDIFALQDKVTQQIVGTLGGYWGRLAEAGREAARRKPPESLQAYDYYLLGIEHKHRFTLEDNKKAQELLNKAIALDPTFSRAYAALAFTYVAEIDNGWSESREQTMANWLDAAQSAVALDRSDGEAHAALAFYFMYSGDSDKAGAEIAQALSFNTNSADVLAQSAYILPWAGKPEQAMENAERAVRLNPHAPNWYDGALYVAYFHGRQFEKAVPILKKTTLEDLWFYVFRSLIYAQLGLGADTAAAIAELLRQDPDYSAERWLSDTGTYARETELSLFLDGVKKAGLPLCASEAQLAKYPDMKRLEQCEQQRASG
jgi:TolB-like protein/class 3 adenylate cyclase/Flp pilus assembly protein TadD